MSNQSNGRPNGGYLFPNKKDPNLDFRGKLNVDGVDHVITGAYLERDGETVISLAVENVTSHGFLAPNQQKTADKHPDVRGRLTVSGKEFAVSGWNKPREEGVMISFALTDPANIPRRDNDQAQKPEPSRAEAPKSDASGGGLDSMGDIFDGLPG